MNLKTKRIYEKASNSDGVRVLIDRIWPRGVSKESASIDYWAKNLAPSSELRKWYRHQNEKWNAFRSKYHAELDANPDELAELEKHLGGEVVTIVYSSKERVHNNAEAFKEYLERYLR